MAKIGQETLKPGEGVADDHAVMTQMDASMRQLIDDVVDGVPGVTGALIASADGFVLASRLPDGPGLDPSAIAAMSAAALGLATRLVQLGGASPALVSVHRSRHAQVFVFAIADSAALTLLADRGADAERVERIGHEVSHGLAHAFRPAPPPS